MINQYNLSAPIPMANVMSSMSPPSAPTNLIATGATGAGNSVGLIWDNIPDAVTYTIKRSTTSGTEIMIDSSVVNSYTDVTAVNWVTYFYVVTAVNGAGESGNSNEVSAMSKFTTDLYGWFKADSLALTNLDPVSAWNDSWTSANNLAQVTSSKMPSFRTNIQNSLPVVRFDGADDIMVSAAFAAKPQPITIIGMQKMTSGSSAMLYTDGVAANPNRVGVLYNSPVAPNIGLFAGAVVTSKNFVAGAFQIGHHEINTVSSVSYIANLAGLTVNPGTQNTTGITIGNNYLGTIPFNGDIGEMLFYNAILSSTERTNLYNYLHAKWNV